MTLANMEGEETFDESNLGYADEVFVDRVCDDEIIVISKPKAKSSSSIVLRGANDFMLDEMERSLHDSLCVVSMENTQALHYSRRRIDSHTCR